METHEKYLNEGYNDDMVIPGFKKQNLKCCRTCGFFIDEYGEEFFCGNISYAHLDGWFLDSGIPLILDNDFGICPKYKKK